MKRIPISAAKRIAEELWRPVVGYEGYYEVSSLGRVRGLDRWVSARPSPNCPNGQRYKVKGRVLRFQPDKHGHCNLSLTKDGEQRKFWVHLLVLRAFVGPCPEGMQGCHDDGNAGNNALSNLRYGTSISNHADKRRHGTLLMGEACYQAKLTEQSVREIRAKAGTKSQADLAAEFGVTAMAINRVIARKTWRHVQDA